MSETASARGLEEDPAHHAPIVRRPADHPGLEGRFGNVTRMVFHPTPERPNEPIAGVITYQPGAGFPRHAHDFAQLWYVLEGECRFGDHRLRAGDMVYMEGMTVKPKVARRASGRGGSARNRPTSAMPAGRPPPCL